MSDRWLSRIGFDEKANHFPPLIEPMAGSEATCLCVLTNGVTADHSEFDTCWQRVRDLLPMAARLLSDAALERIGRAMRERRGIEPVA